MIREAIAEVPGAALRYRLAGAPGELPTIVLENGWGSSYEYFARFQEALAPHAQVLLYDRAGIGGSSSREAVSAEGMSRNLSALLDALDIHEPVVVAGQSYGGLICGVHAALMQPRLRAVVQIDPTPERADPTLDSALSMVRGLGRVMKALAMLRIPDPFFTRSMVELTPAEIASLRRHSFGNAASMSGALVEMDLLPQIREACAQASITPRLLISADNSEEMRGMLSKLVSNERARALIPRMQAHHQATAVRGGPGSRWVALPYTHGGLVMTRTGAAATAAEMIGYLRKLPAEAG